jgi:hypothetical protein
MRWKYFLIIGFILIVSLSFASASYELQNKSFSTKYSPGSFLSGYLEINFSNEPINSVFNDSEGNRFTLKEILKRASGYRYDCNIVGCGIEYIFDGSGETQKTFSISSGEEKVIGFVLNGLISKINSVEFDLTSDAGESELNQLKIDFLDDGTTEIGNSQKGAILNEINYGCYSNSGATENDLIVSMTPYCQRVTFPEAPAFYIGGWIEETISESGAQVNASLYDLQGNKLKECKIPNIASKDFYSCKIDFAVTEPQDYYICVHSNGIGEYKTKGYSSPVSEFNC